MKNVAFILDIQNSRNIIGTDRVYVQERLSEVADFANQIYKEKMKFKLEFSSGDSIQGLFTNPSSAICCYTLIKSAFYPYEIRCGIGAGSLLDMPFENSNRMDGTSYHNAYDAITQSKTESNELLFKSDGKGDRYVNQYLTAAHTLMSKQSHKQRVVSNLVFLLEPLTFSQMNQESYYNGIHSFIRKATELYGPVRFRGLSGTAFNYQAHLESVEYETVFNKKATEGRAHGMISDILDTTYENARQMIAKSDVEMIRSLFISASSLAEHFLGVEE
jgi:hypothetical protein